MLKKLLPILLLLFVCPSARSQCAGTRTCSVSALDNTTIQNALNSINLDNTTLTLPAGSATWSSAVTYNQSFSTIIKGQTTCTSTGTQTPSCTDNTNITGSEFFFTINTAANKFLRLTGFTFQVGSTFNGLLHLTGTSTQVRIDHNHFLHMQAVGVIDGPTGVIDHNFFDFGTSQSVFNGFRVGHGNWLGDQFGDGSWADNSNFGSLKFVFFEDNTAFNGFIDDCNDGGRFVMRHNYFHDATMQGHEMESRMQGCRAYEAYSNTFFAESAQQSGADTSNSMLFRTGTGLIWGNTTNYNNLVTINNDRSDTSHGFSAASSSCTSGGDPSFNCWGYACNNAFAVGTVCDGSHSLPNSPSGFDGNTDSFGYPAFDQVGRGKGDLLPQFDNSNIAFWNAGEPAWPHQQLEPLYLWLNTFTPPFGGPYLGSAIGSNLFQQNRDWYTDNAGSQGVRTGTSLPATCTPSQAFWNTSTSTLSTCTSTNTWTTFYTPAPYPHPLVGATWTYIQDSIITGCTGPATTCNMNVGTGLVPTTAGTIWVVEVQTSNNVTISATHGWTLCPSSKCHLFSSNPARNIDMAYQFAGAAGSTSISVDLSGSSGTIFGVNFFEILPPAGTTASFDDASTASSSTCTTACPGASLTLTGTDAIIQVAHAANTPTWNSWSAPYTTLPLGEGILMNATNGAAPTFRTDATGAVAHGIAFTSTAGPFTGPTQPISVVNFTAPQGINCLPTCSLTIPSTSSGNLLYIEAANTSSSNISSISGGGTWVIPSGANTCRITLSGGNALSCAYVLSSAAGVTSINVTMTGSANVAFSYSEVASTSGPFSFDTQGSTTNSPSFSPPGQSLTLGGTNDVVFQGIFVPGGSSSATYLTQPRISQQGLNFFNNQAALGEVTNVSTVPPTVWEDQQNNATVVSAVAFSSAASSGTSGVSLTPSSLSFGNQAVLTSSSSQPTTLTNTGTATLTISSVAVTGTNTSSFSQNNNCGASLGINASCTINVTFTPQAVQTGLGAAVTVTSNAPSSPNAVSLSGNGTLTISFAPTTLNFFNQFLNTTSSIPQIITVTNQGLAAMTISSIVVTAPFTETDNCSPSLGAGLTCHINVFFTPTVLGPVTGTVTMTDNAVGSPHVANVAGTGVKMVSGVGSITGTGTIKVQP